MTNSTSPHPILIVEDSDDDFEATERAFKKCSNITNPIYRCEDGQDALDYLFYQGKYTNPADAPRPGIILLDLNMPGKDGRDVLAEIQDSPNTDLYKIPIIVLTTSDDESDVEDCYAKGANTYIKKPVVLDDFFRVIRTLKEHWLEISILPRE